MKAKEEGIKQNFQNILHMIFSYYLLHEIGSIVINLHPTYIYTLEICVLLHMLM